MSLYLSLPLGFASISYTHLVVSAFQGFKIQGFKIRLGRAPWQLQRVDPITVDLGPDANEVLASSPGFNRFKFETIPD